MYPYILSYLFITLLEAVAIFFRSKPEPGPVFYFICSKCGRSTANPGSQEAGKTIYCWDLFIFIFLSRWDMFDGSGDELAGRFDVLLCADCFFFEVIIIML
jgi:hypothetical protein